MSDKTIKIESVGESKETTTPSVRSFPIEFITFGNRINGQEAGDIFEALVCPLCSEKDSCSKMLYGVYAVGSRNMFAKSNLFNAEVYFAEAMRLQNAQCRRTGATFTKEQKPSK